MSHVNLKQLLDEYGDGDLTLLPAGDYQVEILSAKARPTDIMPTYKVLGGPYDQQRILAGIFGSVKGNGVSIFYRNCAGAGLGKEFFTEATSLEDVAKALTGRVITLTLTQEDYQGEMRNKLRPGSIRLVAAPPGSGLPSGVPAAAVTQAPATVPAVAPVSAPVPQVEAPAAAPTLAPGVLTQAPTAPLEVVPPGVPVATPAAPVSTPPAPTATAPLAAPVAQTAPAAPTAAPPPVAAPPPPPAEASPAAPAAVPPSVTVEDEPGF